MVKIISVYSKMPVNQKLMFEDYNICTRCYLAYRKYVVRCHKCNYPLRTRARNYRNQKQSEFKRY